MFPRGPAPGYNRDAGSQCSEFLRIPLLPVRNIEDPGLAALFAAPAAAVDRRCGNERWTTCYPRLPHSDADRAAGRTGQRSPVGLRPLDPPDPDLEKIDLLWEQATGTRTVQVKSSQNQISKADAERWAGEIEANHGGADELELVLVGPCPRAWSSSAGRGGSRFPRRCP